MTQKPMKKQKAVTYEPVVSTDHPKSLGIKYEPQAANAAEKPITGAASFGIKMVGIIWKVDPEPIPKARNRTRNAPKKPANWLRFKKQITPKAPTAGIAKTAVEMTVQLFPPIGPTAKV